MDIIEVKILLTAWFITHFEPFNKVFAKGVQIKYVRKIVEVVSCFYCLAFWSVFLITFDFYSACLCSSIAYIYDSIGDRK